jgi:hypothetical protein
MGSIAINAVLAGALFFLIIVLTLLLLINPPAPLYPQITAATSTADVGSSFEYTWNVPGTLEESTSPDQSASPYWWLDSGAKLIIEDGVGKTIEGDLPKDDAWRTSYADANPTDTDDGYHPQNIFRLVTRSDWNNVSVSVPFYIVADHFSSSDQRYESNGLLIMTRYQDSGQTLYYSGVRVDGTAVIKKKFHGEYFTMAQKQIYPGTYNKDKSPDLLPHDTWITLKSDTTTDQDGTVTVQLYRLDNGTWTSLLQAKDDGKTWGDTPPIVESGGVGIRTDFMDVTFGTFSAQEEKNPG